MKRIVLPELLDALPPRDQSALRSRRDLRRINAWMRHPRIMTRLLQKYLLDQDARHIVEVRVVTRSGQGVRLAGPQPCQLFAQMPKRAP